MTDNTEPTIDELISNLACATHFLPEEDCIYCDTEKIEALISDQVAKANEDMLKDLLFMQNEINRILGQREENMKFYGMRMSEDEANNLAVQALEQLQKTISHRQRSKQ